MCHYMTILYLYFCRYIANENTQYRCWYKKNLALCLFSIIKNDNDGEKVSDNFRKRNQNNKVDVINLTQRETAKCCGKDKDQDCLSEVKFSKNGKYYCLKHSKKKNISDQVMT